MSNTNGTNNTNGATKENSMSNELSRIEPEQQNQIVSIDKHQASLIAMDRLARLAERIVNTDYARAHKGKVDAVFAAFMCGDEIGLSPFQSLDSIDVIQGTPTIKPEVMRALIRKEGHDYDIVETDAQHCTIKAHRKEWAKDRWSTYTFSIDDARLAGLTNKDNWRKQPKAMLVARATSLMARSDFPDVIRGLSYTPDEIRDTIEVELSAPVHDAPAVTPNAPAIEPVTAAALPSTADVTEEIALLTEDEKPQFRDWWKQNFARGVKPDAIPSQRAQEVRAKIKAIIDARNPDGPDDDDRASVNNDELSDDQIVDAEIIEPGVAGQTVLRATEGGHNGGVIPTAGSPARNAPGQDSWTEALKVSLRTLGIDPPERNRLATKFFDRPIKRIEDLSDSEIGLFMDFLDDGAYGKAG